VKFRNVWVRTTHAKLGGTVTVWMVSANTWRVTCFGFLRNLCYFILGIVHSRHQWTYFDDLYVIWRVSCKDCLFGVVLILHPILGIKWLQNPHFGGMNRRFQAKCTKYSNCCTIQTSAAIPNKFCRMIKKTFSYYLCIVKNVPTNPKWQTTTILRKWTIVFYLNLLTDFDDLYRQWSG